VHQSLGMYPAQGVEQDGELSRSVADDRQIERETLLDQSAEQRPFGGDAPMAFALDPQGIEMLLPAGDFGNRRMRMRLQAAQRLLGQTLLLQVGQDVRV
jgi:hypothetical protein